MKLTLGRPGWLALVAALATLAHGSASTAATYVWTGTGAGTSVTGSWFNPASSGTLSDNWNPGAGSALGTGNDVQFDFGGTRKIAFQNAAANVANLSFIGSTSGSIAGSANLTVTGNITNSSGVSQTLGSSGQLFMNNTSTIDVGTGGLVLSKALNGSASLTVQGSGGLTITPGVSGFTGRLTNNGSTIQAGQFSGSFIQATGSASFSGALAASGSVNLSGGFLNAMSVNSNNILISGGTAALNNVGVNGGVFTTTGGEIDWTVTAGPTTPYVASTATLGSDNRIVGGDLTSIVSFNDSLTLTSGNVWNLDFASAAGSNQVVDVTGPLVWGGNLALNLTTAGTAANGTAWDFFNFASQSGDLSGVTLSSTLEPKYAGLTFSQASLSSDPQDQKYGAGVWLSTWTSGTDSDPAIRQRFVFDQKTGILTVVPEPSTIVFAGIGAAMLGWQTWAGRRRKARMKLVEEHTRMLSAKRSLA